MKKIIEEQGRKQVKVLELLKPNTQKLTTKDAITENTLTEEAKTELDKIKFYALFHYENSKQARTSTNCI